MLRLLTAWGSFLMALVSLIGCLVPAAFVLYAVSCRPATPVTPDPNTAFALTLQPGETVLLTQLKVGRTAAARQESIWVYRDRAASDAAVEATAAGDPEGLMELRAADRVLLAPPGTRARVLEVDAGALRAEVRLLSGPDAGRRGWVPVPQLMRPGSPP